jgi:GTP-binding protein Era
MSNHRAGLVGVVGRPNVGKSTLVNALVGFPVAITSRKAQTTRHRILGVLTRPDAQVLFVDTPGLQNEHTAALNKQLRRAAYSVVAEVPVLLWVADVLKVTDEDLHIVNQLPKEACVIAVLNKADRIQRDNHRQAAFKLGEQLALLYPYKSIIPISAQSGFQLETLLNELIALLPEGPALMDAEQVTDRPLRFMAAELIREKLFRLLGDELPYEATVVIDQYEESPGRTLIHATIVVGRASHKPMVLGEAGQRLKRIGTEARRDIAKLTGTPVELRLWVKVVANWADQDKLVQSFGYGEL